ncbi:hypothetical protein JKG68_27255 [Microvirga aerilata]|uniref:Uncharacterized protein n=1 Tax=Microvirga aerilata TaxID=670292 RepID=A0A936ZH32_9HYPH|nr:hypothetical protein [Microvirga aerilata]MBL0407620.1 hypothetical protein [Microvirga aerilata]
MHPTPPPQPLSGWPLPVAIRLDRAWPGYLSYLCTCSNLKRQTNFAALSMLDGRGLDEVTLRFRDAGLIESTSGPELLGQVARVLITAQAQAIGDALVGAPSSRLLSLLRVIGDRLLLEESYVKLISLMSPEHEDRGKLLQEGVPVSDMSIEAALRLEPPLLRKEVIAHLSSLGQIDGVSQVLPYVFSLCPVEAQEEAFQSLASLRSSSTSMTNWLIRVVDKVPRFQFSSPMQDTDEVTLLASPNAMRDAGRRFSNCLRRKVPYAFLQRNAYFEWHHPAAIVELQGLSGGLWLLSGIYAPNNKRVDPLTVQTIRDKFKEAGVLVPRHHAEGRAINRSASLFGIHDWDYSECLEEVEPLADLVDLT